MIKVSVMIPVYNTSKYLKKCLDSVINQSLKDIEIICVNDGSTDNSLEILKEFSKNDKRIIIIDKKNGGLTSARNSALEIANGEYCLNIDSDDWIEQGYLEDMYEKAKKEELDILISNFYNDFTSENRIIKKVDLNLEDKEVITGKEYIQQFFTCNFLGYTWNKLIKRELYIKNNIKYNENIFLLEDVEVIGKLGYFAKRIGKLNQAYYHYRIGENNGSFNNLPLKHITDSLECFEKLELFYKIQNEKYISKLIRHKKNLRVIGMILGGKYSNLFGYENIVKKYLDNIQNEEFILKKNNDVLKDEKWIKILLFNLIKLCKIKEKKIKKISIFLFRIQKIISDRKLI